MDLPGHWVVHSGMKLLCGNGIALMQGSTKIGKNGPKMAQYLAVQALRPVSPLQACGLHSSHKISWPSIPKNLARTLFWWFGSKHHRETEKDRFQEEMGVP